MTYLNGKKWHVYFVFSITHIIPARTSYEYHIVHRTIPKHTRYLCGWVPVTAPGPNLWNSRHQVVSSRRRERWREDPPVSYQQTANGIQVAQLGRRRSSVVTALSMPLLTLCMMHDPHYRWLYIALTVWDLVSTSIVLKILLFSRGYTAVLTRSRRRVLTKKYFLYE